MQILCLDVLKSHCCLRQTECSCWQNLESLIHSGSAELCGVMDQYFSCMLMLQRDVLEDLVSNTIVNASLPQLSMEEEVSWCGEPFSAAGTGELLHCEKSINALEYRRILQKSLLPTIDKLFSKAEQSDVIFQQDKTWLENKSIRLKSQRLEPYREYLVSH